MGVNGWGASPLYGNTAIRPGFMVRRMAEALDRSNCGIARSRGKEAAVKPVSRRTEMPYQADGAGKLAPHRHARCSTPEVNGAVAQAEFTSLLREVCSPSPAAGSGAASSNGRRARAEVSRGRSTESNEPVPTGGPHDSGRAEPDRQYRPWLDWWWRGRRMAELT